MRAREAVHSGLDSALWRKAILLRQLAFPAITIKGVGHGGKVVFLSSLPPQQRAIRQDSLYQNYSMVAVNVPECNVVVFVELNFCSNYFSYVY